MRKPKPTLLIAAALLMCLSACASVTGAALPNSAPQARRAQLAPMCPTPSNSASLAQIEGELSRAIAAKVPPNVLAREWERLDEAARKCRGL